MTDQKYRVRGSDYNGDGWTFTTSDRERAEDMFRQFREDLEDVQLHAPPEISTAPPRQPVDYYIPAKGFIETTKIVASSPLVEGREGLVFLASQTLIGFSLELYLKAWLSHCGVSEEALMRRPYGHNLQRLYDDCVASGLPTIGRLDELVRLTRGPHSDYTYRYFRSDLEYTTMGLMGAFAVLSELDTLVDREIGASAAHGLEPGH